MNIKEYRDSENFKTELKTFSGLYFCKNNKKKMSEYIETHTECANIDSDTFWTIANIADRSYLKGLEKYNEKEEISVKNTSKATKDIA
ncbi:MAG: hypothetical protein K2M60_06075 [Lachnospiraceae bacterium]|nr:hypothetical protein [Lachnospiraceae bacterium]MDE6252684.1 hypothetical protein [Lachnospiraceae bacterium]